MGNPYGTRQLVSVIPFTGSSLRYGFLTNELRTVLGQATGLSEDGGYVTGLVIGANAPKPGRATKERATGVESSFYGFAARAAAIAAGWKLSPGRVRNGSSSARSKTVHIVYQGNKIAWKMPQYLYSKLTDADRTALGIVPSAASDLDLVFGVRYPRLPRVAKILVPDGSEIGNRLTTFCDPSKLDNLPAGWATVKASTDRI